MTSNVIDLIFHFFKDLGIWGSFLSMLVENLGIPLPTEIGYLIAQDLINRGMFSYPIVLVILTAGHITGALISYAIGRFGRDFVTKKFDKNRRLSEIQRRLEKWYKNYGNFTVFLTRFVGYVRPWSSFVAGFANVPLMPFVIWTSLGSLIFNVCTLYLSGIFLLIWRKYSTYHVLFIAISMILFFGLIIYELVKYFIAERRSKH